MQFIRNGPEVPERLLREHEEGRLVFFCGAGVSSAAGLPGFKGLTEELYKSMGETPNAVQRAALKAGQFDSAIGLLEASVAPGPRGVRKILSTILTPDLKRSKATATHEALLTLCQTRDGRRRLVTTNFDRLFVEAAKRLGGIAPSESTAPLLSIPKSQWNEIVYLHGQLKDPCTPKDLDCLVLSSGDFGRAYLTERWAARFVSELFRRHTVCFVGYSVSDPVLRYMLDALAADRQVGEATPEVFAFAEYSKSHRPQRESEWLAKNVTPILYRAHRKHQYLHETLRQWAKTYRDGVRGKERVVVESALVRPAASTVEDDFVGRVLWALSDSSGIPARRFSELDPVPALEWLEPLSEARYGHADLVKFGVPPKGESDPALKFGFTSRPSPYWLAPSMRLVGPSSHMGWWDDVMFHLANWLLRHLGDPALVLWVAKHGGVLHSRFRDLIVRRLDHVDEWEQVDPAGDLDRLRAGSPQAVPAPALRVIWRLILAGRVKGRAEAGTDFYEWVHRIRMNGLSGIDRLTARELLRPMVSIREKLRWPGHDSQTTEATQPSMIVDCELVLAADHVHAALNDGTPTERWRLALKDLVPELNQLLRDAMDLRRELGDADEKSDRSYIQQPSITPHSQNRDYNDWTALVELLRDGWLVVADEDPKAAARQAHEWWSGHYPIFRRLALYAAAHDDVLPAQTAVDWLLEDRGAWFWSTETQREVFRLLTFLGPQVADADLARLQTAIVAGPSTEWFREDIDAELLVRFVKREIWIRLKKLDVTGAALTAASMLKLTEIQDEFPDWTLSPDEREEFPFWVGAGWVGELPPGTEEPGFSDETVELQRQLREGAASEDKFGERWARHCREKFSVVAESLLALANEGVVPSAAWRQAFYAWHEPSLASQSWNELGATVATFDPEQLTKLTPAVSSWVRTASKETSSQQGSFLTIVDKVLAKTVADEVGLGDEEAVEDAVSIALNSPVGHVTDVLVNLWLKGPPKDNEMLGEPFRSRFEAMCAARHGALRPARVLLAAHVMALYRVDREWTRAHVLPLFRWTGDVGQAVASWQGFLWSPRLYRPLLADLHDDFLLGASHFWSLGEFKDQYSALLTYAALEPGDTFTTRELRESTRALPAEALVHVVDALVRALAGADEDREAFWEKRLVPYLQSVWPNSIATATTEVAAGLARLCVSAEAAFPSALSLLQPWLRPLPLPGHVVHLMHESKLCTLFPEESLTFLDAIIGTALAWMPRELGDCLSAIRIAQPNLEADGRFARLANRVGI